MSADIETMSPGGRPILSADELHMALAAAAAKRAITDTARLLEPERYSGGVSVRPSVVMRRVRGRNLDRTRMGQ